MLSEKRKEKNRNNLGRRLKDARKSQGYTQKALADALGIEYYTVISQMELGYMSIPASLWGPIADVLGMDRTEWIVMCLNEYSPEVYSSLFQNRSRNEVGRLLSAFSRGHLDDYLTD